jgi:RimJ/RimL family protein N-acetyltransferase
MLNLETTRLVLRPFVESDLDALAGIFADPRVMRYLPAGQGISRERTQAALTRYIESWEICGYGLNAVIEKGSQKLIGHCGLAQLDHTEQIELAYGFAHSHWGQGFATEAATACVTFGFDVLNLEQIVAIVVPENTASQRVLEKLGMQYIQDASFYNLKVRYFRLTQAKYRQNPITSEQQTTWKS